MDTRVKLAYFSFCKGKVSTLLFSVYDIDNAVAFMKPLRISKPPLLKPDIDVKDIYSVSTRLQILEAIRKDKSSELLHFYPEVKSQHDELKEKYTLLLTDLEEIFCRIKTIDYEPDKYMTDAFARRKKGQSFHRHLSVVPIGHLDEMLKNHKVK